MRDDEMMIISEDDDEVIHVLEKVKNNKAAADIDGMMGQFFKHGRWNPE